MERITKAVEVGGVSVTVKELTVAEYRRMLLSQRQSDFLSLFLVDDLTFDEVMSMSSITIDELESLTPSQLAALAAEIKEINRPFFLAQIKAAAAVLEAQRAGQISTEN